MTHVRIFDTTLRDGEQAPGFSMTEAGKLKMARALAALNVDVIEAGFAAASPGDFRALQGISAGGSNCSVSQCRSGRGHSSRVQLRSQQDFLDETIGKNRGVVRSGQVRMATPSEEALGA